MIKLKERFREFLPVVVDIETAGVTPHTDAILEICACPLSINENGKWQVDESLHNHIEPFAGANMCQESIDFLGIDPYHPFRFAKSEYDVLTEIYSAINKKLKQHQCKRAVLVGHNSWFDLLFLKNANKRCKLKSPFHSFTSFDTATLSALVYGETVLVKACHAAKVYFDPKEAHSALYDARKTAELFCTIINNYE